MKRLLISLLTAGITITLYSSALAGASPEVTIHNYVRAETDLQMRTYIEKFDCFGKFFHVLEAYDVNSKATIRPNRDTLYSWGVFDLTSPLTIGLPDPGDRYQSLEIVSQDHSIWAEYGPKDVVLTEKNVGTRYALLLVRTFLDPNDEVDVKAAHALQDAITVKQADQGKFQVAPWKQEAVEAMRNAINILAPFATDSSKTFGRKEDLDPIYWILGAAVGWGGLPAEDSTYTGAFPEKNDGKIPQMTGSINQFVHLREPTPLDNQNVIRMNRDTLYSAAIVDISNGATLTVPDAGGRYMSIMVVNEDHYINKVIHKPGEHQLTVEEYGTPFVNLSVRTLVNASDPGDVAKANALQDKLKIEAESAKPYSHPAYDEASYKVTYEALLVLGKGLPDASATFGKKEDVDPVRHLLGTAWGWGGLPEKEAYYLNVEPNLPVGAYQITVSDVPVDAFWSVSVYNKDGYFEANEQNAYSVNNLTGTPNKDGSFTIHFGGDPGSVNHLPITEGWNYAVRFYMPRKNILEGKWTFPDVKPVEAK